MSSEKQIAANRRNGKKGGPKTLEGKARSSQNAATHYLTSKSNIVKTDWHTETFAEREKFRGKMMDLLEPKDELLVILADTIVDSAWRLKRFKKFEEAISVEMFAALQQGERINELRVLEQQIMELRETVSTFQNDIAITQQYIRGGFPESNDDGWGNALYHLRTFLEKTMLFSSAGDFSANAPIAESNEIKISYLCDVQSITILVLMEQFQGYLQEQFSNWNNELQRLLISYEQLQNQQPKDVTESSYVLAVESHPLIQKSQPQLSRLQRSFLRTLKDYKQLNFQKDADPGLNN